MQYKYFLLIVLLAIIASCKKKPHCVYEIELPVTFVNKADTVSVGDTLHFESVFSEQVPEDNHVELLELNDIDLFPAILIVDINAVSADHSGGNFTVDFERGALKAYTVGSDGSGIWACSYDFEDDQFLMSTSVVAHRAGNYAIVFASLFSAFDEGTDFRPDECRSEQMEAEFKMNNGDPEENNYHLMQYAQDNIYSGITEEDFLSGGYFAFVVEE